MLKTVVVFGTRPEAIKLAPVIKELEKYPDTFKTIVCVTAQHREMLDQVLNLFEIVPDYDLDIMQANQSLFDVTTRVLLGIKDVLEKEKPDLVLVQGDTTTTFATSLASFYLRIPIGHVEAGLRTHDKYQPFPEEINRRVTSHIVDLHFAPTKRAKENLLSEGINEDGIFVTGNTAIDALHMTIKKLEKEPAKIQELNSRFPFLYADSTKLLLVTGHRRENLGQGFENICYALKEIVENNPDVVVVYPVHLNPNVRKPVMKILGGIERISLVEPLEYDLFVALMHKSYLVLTDSGGIQEEAPGLAKPVLVLRDTTERPEGIEAGTARLVGTNMEKIIIEVNRLLHDESEYLKMARVVNPYGAGKASKKIIETLKQRRFSDINGGL